MGPLLDDHATVHHGDSVRDVSDRREIVRDEKIGELELVAQIRQEIEDRRLNRDVKRGDRFVADDESRIARQCPGNADTLPFATAELVRKALSKNYRAIQPIGAVPRIRA